MEEAVEFNGEAVGVNKESMGEPNYEAIANQLMQENNQLRQILQQTQMDNLLKRLDYLFKVIDMSLKSNGKVFGKDFVKNSIAEVEAIMTIKEEEAAAEEGNLTPSED